MIEATDFAIFQRGKDNAATVCVSGILENIEWGGKTLCRVVREEDQSVVVPWTPCKMNGQSYRVELMIPAGGLYRIEVTCWDGSNNISWNKRIRNIQHVGVGELYLITGQSNMSGYGRDAAYDPPQLEVHLFGNNGRWQIAAHPLNDSIDSIFPENYEPTTGTSPLLAFGRMMNRRLGVPIGLIQTSMGASPMSQWHPEEDGRLYRGMMRRIPMTGPVGGIVWYQGCSDTDSEDTAKTYLSRFTRMIELWRNELGDIPVVTAQLNRFIYNSEERNRNWGYVREAQRLAANMIPHVYVVSTTDLGTSDPIHNMSGSNVILGERLANALLAGEYGQATALAPDVEQVVKINDKQVRLSFRHSMQNGIIVLNSDVLPIGIDAEDNLGLNPAVKIEETSDQNCLIVTFTRTIEKNSRFHAYWTSNPPFNSLRGVNGIPMLSCYNVPICEE